MRRYRLLALLLTAFGIISVLMGVIGTLGALEMYSSVRTVTFSRAFSILNPLISGVTACLVALAAAALLNAVGRGRSARASRAQEVAPAYQPPAELFDEERALFQAQRKFEAEVAQVLNAITGYRTETVEGDRGGISVKIYDGKGMVGIAMCVFAPDDKILKVELVQQLANAQRRLVVPAAYLITTGRFSPLAVKQAFTEGVRLIDGEQYRMMRSQARVAG